MQTSVVADRLRSLYARRLGGRPVVVLPNSAFPIAGSRAPTAPLAEASGADWLLPTRYYPHKNLDILIDIARILARRGEREVRFLLTVRPDDHPRAAAFVRATHKPRLARYFIHLGRLHAREMEQAYARALGVLNPSLLEAQCFGYLEALAYGRPLVISDLDFAHSVCGNAAVYASASDPEALADAVCHLSRAPALRASLATAGRARFEANEAETAATFGRYVALLGSSP